MPRKTIHNNLTSEDLIAKISKENKEIMGEFINYLKSVDKSNNTINSYINDLNIFLCWNVENNNNKFFIDFTKRDIMKYQNYLIHDLQHSPNRVRRLKSSMSSMSNFIENVLDEEYPDFKNIVNKIPAPDKIEVRDKTIMSDEQVEQLLNYLVENKKYQQACAVALAVGSGSRKAEILRFKVSYFIDENIKYGALYKTPEKIKTKGRSSKGKMIYRWVLVSQFKPYFDLWMKQREELGITGEELFWNKRKNVWKPADISTLNSWALTFSKILGIDWYWHSNRHYFTTSMCQANIPSSVIKDIVGWDSTNMVDIYNDTEVDDEVGKYFDESGIKQVEKKSLSDL
jgi:site-specific recombinase XerD